MVKSKRQEIKVRAGTYLLAIERVDPLELIIDVLLGILGAD